MPVHESSSVWDAWCNLKSVNQRITCICMKLTPWPVRLSSACSLPVQCCLVVLSDDLAGDRHNMSGQAIQLK